MVCSVAKKKKCNPQEACKNVENCDLTEGQEKQNARYACSHISQVCAGKMEWERGLKGLVRMAAPWVVYLKFLSNCPPSSYRCYYSHFRGEETEAHGGDTVGRWWLLRGARQLTESLYNPVCLPTQAFSSWELKTKPLPPRPSLLLLDHPCTSGCLH